MADETHERTFSSKSPFKSVTCGEWNSFADATATIVATRAQIRALNIVIGVGGLECEAKLDYSEGIDYKRR